ncbi:hypothetical protein F5Y14DRAFT_417032 [Nemania sp. NC0429]|nr:hypothetical protein F5Y14DRAFT_417032 [Nemania sp. NC0429]
MDADRQDAPFRSWLGSETSIVSQSSSDDSQTEGASLAEEPDHHAEANANGRDTKDAKGREERGSSETETEVSNKEQPPPPTTTSPPTQQQSPLKKRPTSSRPSGETFRSLATTTTTTSTTTDAFDDDKLSKKSSLSISVGGSGGGGDSGSSIYTIDSSDERRLSDKMKKAWRGVTGQRQQAADPLERWMVTHSGGTFREVPVGRPGAGESSSSDRR